jgi:hypothetical protein
MHALFQSMCATGPGGCNPSRLFLYFTTFSGAVCPS